MRLTVMQAQRPDSLPACIARHSTIDWQPDVHSQHETLVLTFQFEPEFLLAQELADSCMSTDPKGRPTFSQILQKLEALQQAGHFGHSGQMVRACISLPCMVQLHLSTSATCRPLWHRRFQSVRAGFDAECSCTYRV